MKQPDFGSTIIFCAVWVAMLALAGVSMRILGGLAVAGIVGVVLAYFFYPTSRRRGSTSSCSAPATISRSRMRCGR
jgi:cell division protein FtsW